MTKTANILIINTLKNSLLIINTLAKLPKNSTKNVWFLSSFFVYLYINNKVRISSNP